MGASILFSEFVKAKRRELGMSLQDVADLANLSKSHVWEIEQATSCPTIDTAKAIAVALCIPLWRVFKEAGL
jgi:transcriptional regulator with XRE-family HTH domain